jgi:hypothetical protein
MKKSNAVPTSIIPKTVNPNTPAQRFAREKILSGALAFRIKRRVARLAKQAEREGSEKLAAALMRLAKDIETRATARFKDGIRFPGRRAAVSH